MQAQEGVGVQFYSFLTWALNKGGWLVPYPEPAALLPENFPDNQCTGCSVGPRAGLEGRGE
jgi:hypothetical protein